MPLPRVSLRSFLSTAKKALQNAEHISPSYAVVIGNESADLDSLCSAVVFAYLRTYAPRSKTFYIPLSNLQPRDLALRPELVPVLKYAGLGVGELVTLGDLCGLGEGKDGSRWILVDHNRMTGNLGEIYADNVVGCIDHHVDEHAVPSVDVCAQHGEPRIVEKSGSCASLVVGYCREAWDALAAEGKGSKEMRRWDRELARLALAPVLIDTQNLGDAGKTTGKDREAVRYLEGWLRKGIVGKEGEGEGGSSAKDYFEEITNAKGDIGGLSLEDILRKDYKLWVEDGDFKLGISSVVKSVAWLVKKSGGLKEFAAAMEGYRRGRGLDICAVMTTWNGEGGVFRRELVVLGRGERGVQTAKRFETETGKGLRLERWAEGKLDGDDNVVVSSEVGGKEKAWMRCWDQGNVGSSRKQVAPLMREAIAK